MPKEPRPDRWAHVETGDLLLDRTTRQQLVFESHGDSTTRGKVTATTLHPPHMCRSYFRSQLLILPKSRQNHANRIQAQLLATTLACESRVRKPLRDRYLREHRICETVHAYHPQSQDLTELDENYTRPDFCRTQLAHFESELARTHADMIQRFVWYGGLHDSIITEYGIYLFASRQLYALIRAIKRRLNNPE